MLKYVASVLCMVLISCGGGGDSVDYQIRYANFSSDAGAVDFQVSSKSQSGLLQYQSVSDYKSVDMSISNLRILSGNTTLSTQTFDLPSEGRHTFILFGRQSERDELLFFDDADFEIPSVRTALRLINAGPETGTLNVYVFSSDQNFTDIIAEPESTPDYEGFSFKRRINFDLWDEGTYKLVYVRALDDSILGEFEITLTGGTSQTFVLSEGDETASNYQNVEI